MEDFVHPVQPFFVFTSLDYYKKGTEGTPISHIYKFRVNQKIKTTNRPLIQSSAVPDGVADILMKCSKTSPKVQLNGTVLQRTPISLDADSDYIGIRFLPGVLPHLFNISAKELVSQEILLEDVIPREIYDNFVNNILSIDNFQEQSRYILEDFLPLLYPLVRPTTKTNLFNSLLKKTNAGRGDIRINDLAEYSGYSTRYVTQVFNEYMGFGPKKYAQIVRFQNLMTVMNHGESYQQMHQVAMDQYYDQSHLINEFKKFTKVTPKTYKKIIQKTNYSSRIKLY